VQVVGFYFCILILARYKNENNQICAVLGFYAVLNGKCVLTFLDKITVPSSTVNNWIQNYHSTLHKIPEGCKCHLRCNGSLVSWTCDMVTKEILYITLTELSIPRKLVRLIKMHVNKTYVWLILIPLHHATCYVDSVVIFFFTMNTRHFKL